MQVTIRALELVKFFFKMAFEQQRIPVHGDHETIVPATTIFDTVFMCCKKQSTLLLLLNGEYHF